MPPFYSTMRMLRLPSPFSSPSVSLGLDTTFDTPFLVACQGGDIYPNCPDCWGSVNPYNRILCGSVRLSCVPVLPLSVSDMFSDPGRIAPARHIRWLDIALTVLKIKASTLDFFEAQ